MVGKFHRDGGILLNIAGDINLGSSNITGARLDIVVEAMGRSNFGCEWDFKGLQSRKVTINGALPDQYLSYALHLMPNQQCTRVMR